MKHREAKVKRILSLKCQLLIKKPESLLIGFA